MTNLYRGPSNDASNQALIHLPRRFQRRRCFRNQPIKYKNGLWWPCLLADQDEINNLYKGPSIVSVHLAKRLQRRRFLKIGQSEDCNLNLITVGKLNTEVNSYVPFWQTTILNKQNVSFPLYLQRKECFTTITYIHYM